jgi:hypothetical protein
MIHVRVVPPLRDRRTNTGLKKKPGREQLRKLQASAFLKRQVARKASYFPRVTRLRGYFHGSLGHQVLGCQGATNDEAEDETAIQ